MCFFNYMTNEFSVIGQEFINFFLENKKGLPKRIDNPPKTFFTTYHKKQVAQYQVNANKQFLVHDDEFRYQ
jgi:hypothetical protein